MNKKEISKKIKQLLNKSGIKAKVRGGKGTAYNWIDVWSEDFGRCFTVEEREKMRDILGIGDPGNSNCYSNEIDRWEAILNRIDNKDTVDSEEYKDLIVKFKETALNFTDSGTCCLGAGTFIIKDNKKIDFIRQLGMSDSRNWKAEESLKEDFNKLGLTTLHEAGVMD